MMRRHVATLTGAAILFAMGLAWAGQGATGDTKGLDDNLQAWAAAFNAHDAKAIAALYTEDADVVVTTGDRYQGRAAIEKSLADFFAAHPKVQTKLSVISRRFIGPDMVVEDGRWEESGHAQVGLPTRGLFTTVLVKQGGTWLAACDRGYVPAGAVDKDSGKK